MDDYHENLSAEQIRQQMSYVRRELNDDVDQVVENVSSLSDVRAYVKAQPIGWILAAAAVGYLLVPSNNKSNVDWTVNGHSLQPANDDTVKKSSLMGAAMGMAATFGTRMLARKVAEAGLGMFTQDHRNVFSSQSNSGSAEFSNYETTGFKKNNFRN